MMGLVGWDLALVQMWLVDGGSYCQGNEMGTSRRVIREV
jgi:hypothetical protein